MQRKKVRTEMKNIFKRLHIGNSHDPNRSHEASPSSSSAVNSQSGVSDLCITPPVQNSGTSMPSPPSSSPSPSPAPPTAGSTSTPQPAQSNLQDYFSSEEEFQVQLALAISASNSEFRDDPEKDQIRAATLLSLGGHRTHCATNKDHEAEALSRQYWEYNVLDYEERVADGFYDVYSLCNDAAMQKKMPSLADLEGNPGSSNFEIVVVNRKIDPVLEELLQIAHCIALDCPVTKVGVLVQRLAELVTGHMGGPVKDANMALAKWMERSTELRTSLHTSVWRFAMGIVTTT